MPSGTDCKRSEGYQHSFGNPTRKLKASNRANDISGLTFLTDKKILKQFVAETGIPEDKWLLTFTAWLVTSSTVEHTQAPLSGVRLKFTMIIVCGLRVTNERIEYENIRKNVGE